MFETKLTNRTSLICNRDAAFGNIVFCLAKYLQTFRELPWHAKFLDGCVRFMPLRTLRIRHSCGQGSH